MWLPPQRPGSAPHRLTVKTLLMKGLVDRDRLADVLRHVGMNAVIDDAEAIDVVLADEIGALDRSLEDLALLGVEREWSLRRRQNEIGRGLGKAAERFSV